MAEILAFPAERGARPAASQLSTLLCEVAGAQKRTVNELEALLDGLETAAANFLRLDLSPGARDAFTHQARMMESARAQLRELHSYYDRDRSIVPLHIFSISHGI